MKFFLLILICMHMHRKHLEHYNFNICTQYHNAAYFYDIHVNSFDFHHGIVDTTVLARLICKMNLNNDKYYYITNFYSGQPIENGKKIIIYYEIFLYCL